MKWEFTLSHPEYKFSNYAMQDIYFKDIADISEQDRINTNEVISVIINEIISNIGNLEYNENDLIAIEVIANNMLKDYHDKGQCPVIRLELYPSNGINIVVNVKRDFKGLPPNMIEDNSEDKIHRRALRK